MSLINDVLKDLERRQATPDRARQGPAAPRHPAPGRPVWRWPLWLLAAVAAGVVVHLSLDSPGTPARPDQPEPFVAQAEPVPASRSPAPPIETARANPAATAPAGRTDATNGTDTVSPEQKAPAVSAQAEKSRQAAAADKPGRDPRTDQSPAAVAAPDTVSEKASETDPQTDSEQALQPRQTLAATSDTQADSAPATKPEEEPTISIRRSGDGGDEASDPLASAKRMLARGQDQRAESRLRPIVRQQPELTEAHELLARALIQRERTGQAAEVLEAGLAQAAQPEQLATLLGRLLIERGEIARARAILAEHAPPLAEAPEHHLLLAAAHRQFGDHEAAAGHYRRLAKILPRRGAVWVGLGASLESLERPSEAASAYNRAVDGDNARASRFARQRLDALEPQIGELQ